jgi:quinoprotein glucose dehydrogenase
MKRLALTALSSVLAVVIPSCHSFAEVGDGWNHYGGSEKGLQYSSADQINLSNVNNLKEAWRFRTGELGEGTQRGYSFQNNPILVRGTLYISTGSGIIIAVDPKTGTEKWRYDPKFDRSKRASESANRGVSSWIDTTRQEAEACFHRI